MEWIRVDDRLPEDHQFVLVHPPFCSPAFPDEPHHVLYYDERLNRFNYYGGDSIHSAFHITHWAELPKYDSAGSVHVCPKCGANCIVCAIDEEYKF